MGQINDSYGNITTRQGDTFYIPLKLTQEETEKKGTLFMQAINEKRKQMFPEEATRNVVPGETEFDFEVSADKSDLLTVPKSEDSATYRYAVKWCSSSGVEDTWIIGGMEFDELPTITVYPKIVNGGTGTDVDTYTWWTATDNGTTYRGKTKDSNNNPTTLVLTEPVGSAGNYTISSVNGNSLTITTTESIPTIYYKDGYVPYYAYTRTCNNGDYDTTYFAASVINDTVSSFYNSDIEETTLYAHDLVYGWGEIEDGYITYTSSPTTSTPLYELNSEGSMLIASSDTIASVDSTNHTITVGDDTISLVTPAYVIAYDSSASGVPGIFIRDEEQDKIVNSGSDTIGG